jgi:hypothetical protein
MNEHGWVIYRDPETSIWYTRVDAMVVRPSAPGRALVVVGLDQMLGPVRSLMPS